LKAFIHPSAIVENPGNVGEGTKIWHWVHVMPKAQIGRDCILGQNVFVGNDVILGNNVRVQNNVSIYDAVRLEDDVFCGPSMVFTNVINPRSAIERKEEYLPTIVKKGASIGANATVVCGNEIGKYAFIGAGSVVTNPVNNYALVVGNPARQIGWVSKAGHRLEFDEAGIAICTETGEKYLKIDDKVSIIEP
jgi:UDP-2-acetamido-3-amino-2,3-dideoxy-glucuronate N-acetyltransferase